MVGDPFVTASARVIDLAFLAAVEAAGNPFRVTSRRPRKGRCLVYALAIEGEALPDSAREAMETMVAEVVWHHAALVTAPVIGVQDDGVVMVRVDGFF